MRIEELTPGMDVTFYVNIVNEQQMTFESKIIEVDRMDHMIIAEAIIKDGKVLSFKANRGTTVDMVVTIPDEKPVWFQNVTMETLKLSDDRFGYNLRTPKEGIPYNRRIHFRCFIGNSTYLIDEKSTHDYDVILRDVSASGFSIICGPEVHLESDQLAHVVLEDYLEELNRHYSFHLFGLAVRRQELENDKFIYGFRLNNRVGGLENYLIQKERIHHRKKSKTI